MVTTSTSAQTHDHDRRKKYTLEKTKVIHLTRQLQLRLQYAKLKVDHGWQRQNLNEVENLYFHHSHIRVPKPHAIQPISLATAAAAAAKRAQSELELNNLPSTSSSLLQGESRGIIEVGSVNSSSSHGPDDKAADSQPTTQQSDNVIQVDPTTQPATVGSSVTTSLPSHHSQSNLHDALMQVLSTHNKKSTSSPQQTRTSPSTSHFVSSNKTANTRLLSPSSNTALTYDSFWSNHNTSRPFRSSFLNLLSSTDLEANKATAEALLSSLSGKSINSYTNTATSDLPISASSPASDTTPTLTPMTRRNVSSAATISDSSKG